MKSAQRLKMLAGVASVAFALNVNAQTGNNLPADQTASDTTASSGPHETAGEALHHTGDRISDGTITTKVKTALLAAKGLKSTHIHVHTRGGTVRLTGTVPDKDQRSMADDVTHGVSGVTSVINHLKVVGTE
ncbi:MAG: BON domain-containing protein [Janthinobacterium lividum]